MGSQCKMEFWKWIAFTQTQGYYHTIDYSQGINTDITTVNDDQLGIIYADLNQGRLSSYHRLDLAIKKHFEIKENSTLDLTFSVTNVYSREKFFMLTE